MATILIPLDGSSFAESALPHALLFACSMEANLKLLRVITPGDQLRLQTEELVQCWDDTHLPPDEFRCQILQILREEAEDYLASQVQSLCAAGLEVESQVLVGDVASVIVEQISAIQPTLVVMASHGYSGFKRWAVGSVTDRVVSASSAPVLVVRSDTTAPPPSIQRILVPLDGSPLAAQALPLALVLAQRTKAELILLRVVEPLILVEPQLATVYFKQTQQLQSEAYQELEATAVTLRKDHEPISIMITEGYPAGSIILTAENQHADLIVMATHGYTGLRRWALGSTADKVLHAARVPLILVRNINN